MPYRNNTGNSSAPPIPKRRAAISGSVSDDENPSLETSVKLENSRTDSAAHMTPIRSRGSIADVGCGTVRLSALRAVDSCQNVVLERAQNRQQIFRLRPLREVGARFGV